MVSRREYLHGVPAAALASLAGCTGLPFVGVDGQRGPAVVEARNVSRVADFGRAVAVADDILVVGAPAALNDAGNFGGAAFLYEHDGDEWVAEARLQPNPDDLPGPHFEDPGGRLSFGSYVAVADGTVVVGTADAPAAYVYERSGQGWDLDASVYPAVRDAVERRLALGDDDDVSPYGTSMAFDGDALVLATNCGVDDADVVVETVHVFEERDHEWTEVASLQRPEPHEWDRYGYAVAVDGDALVVGSTEGGDDGHESQRAVVHGYERTDSEWRRRTELRPDPAYTYGGRPLHNSIAVSGDVLAVGGDQGGTHVYERSDGDWTHRANVRPEALGDGRPFAPRLAVQGDALVAATPDAALDTDVAGSAFRYERSGGEWSLAQRYSEHDAVSDAEFGASVALSEARVAVGGTVRRDDLANLDVVYVFPR